MKIYMMLQNKEKFNHYILKIYGSDIHSLWQRQSTGLKQIWKLLTVDTGPRYKINEHRLTLKTSSSESARLVFFDNIRLVLTAF